MIRNSLICVFVWFAVSGVASTKAINVVVRDAKTSGPVDAVVTLQGPVTVAGTADVDGNVTFESMAPGSYTLTVRRQGYHVLSQRITFDADQSITIDVRLAKTTQLRQIAAVSVRASVSQMTSTIDDSSTIRILSPSLGSALSDIPGVTLSNPTQPGAPQTVSILGHDPSETAFSLDGVPLNIPGIAFNFGAIDSDILDSINVGYGPSGNAAGGSVALKTLEPTTSWQTELDGNLASFNRSFWSISEQGTAGRLGVAYKQAFRANNSPLDGDVYEDASDLTYRHDGTSISRGDALALDYRISPANTASFTSLDSSGYTAAVCILYTNALPCGYGPGNAITNSFHLSSISDAFSLGPTNWTVAGYSFAEYVDAKFNEQVLANLALPYMDSENYKTTGYSLTGEIPIKSDVLHLEGNSNNVAWTAASFVPQTQELNQSVHYATFSASDRHRLSKKATLTLRAQASSLTGTKGALSAQINGTLQNTDSQTTTIDAFIGRNINAGDQAGSIVSTPSALQYNCTSRTATGAAPGDAQSTNSLESLSAGWSDQLPRGGDVSINGYEQFERNGSLSALVSAVALPPSFFFPGYFALGQQIFNLPTICPDEVLSPQQFYFSTLVSDVNLEYSGFRFQADLPISQELQLRTTASLNRVVAWSNDSRLNNPYSVFRPGQQVQGVPVASAYASLAYTPTVAAVPRVYVGARYNGYDGPSSLPAYLTVDAAAVQTLDHGQISVLVNNLFDTYGGKFATPEYAVPLVTNSGLRIPGVAVPNEPRTFTVQYSIGIGPNAVVRNAVGQAFGEESGEDSLVPGYLLEKWPTSRPPDAFRRNNGVACTAKEAQIADQIMTPLKALITSISVQAPHYPTAVSIGTTQIPGLSVSYSHSGTSFALSMIAQRISTTQAVLSCQLVHIGTQENARSATLPYPSSYSLTSASFFYTPSIGLYYIQLRPPANLAQKFRTYALPSSPPIAPFRLNEGALCEPELHSIATELLSELAQAFSRPSAVPSKTLNWDISQHRASAGPWFELRSDEIGAVTSMLNCSHVSSATRSELQKIGFDGSPSPAFNYAPSVGIYVISGR